MKKKTIICFTASYPYSTGEETFFGKELEFIAQEFDIVYIQPMYNPSGNKDQWPYPDNVICWEPLPHNNLHRILKGTFNFSPLNPFIKDFFRYKVFLSTDRFLRWLHSLIIFRLLFTVVKANIKKNERPLTLYAYWASTAMLFPAKYFKQYKKVVRMHGGDFYLYRNNNYLPIRADIYRSANLLAPISSDIANNLTRVYKVEEKKIYIGRLGIDNYSSSCTIKTTQPLKIVSCSNLIPLKRVHLIAEALTNLKSIQQIEWHHFGVGSDFEGLSVMTRKFPINIKSIFHGWVSNKELFLFYEQNYISWFINVSKYEGIPVSIMEAFSFGIPAIATDVGGTKELVNIYNGHLLPADLVSKMITSLILDCTSPDYLTKRVRAYETWRRSYNARNNYNEFAKKIASL